MRHLDLLQLSTDGRISDRAWAEAASLDRAEMAVAPARLRIAAIVPSERAVLARMGRVIATAAVARAQVHLLDFEREGIDERTARRLYPRALAIARAREAAVDQIAESAA